MNIYVVSTGRNAGSLVEKCIESVATQTLNPKTHTLIDDCSEDDTRDILMPYLYDRKKYENLDIIFNNIRKYRLRNLYDNIINKDPEDIICMVDTDDWLFEKTVLQEVYNLYKQNPKLEYVYSKFVTSHGTQGLSRAIPSSAWDPYKNPWITSHLCTIKAKVLNDIPVENFLDWEGNWFDIATDHALILPVIYNLKQKHGDYSAIGFIEKPLYVHTFYGNPSKPRSGTPEAAARAIKSVKCANFIKQRGFIK
jgi:glycosyltransferase involved in cell wall biosynthesis